VEKINVEDFFENNYFDFFEDKYYHENLVHWFYEYGIHLDRLLDGYLETTSRTDLEDFCIFCEKESVKLINSHCNKYNNERDGLLNPNRYGMDSESRRLASSLEYFINENTLHSLGCLSLIKDNYIEMIAFFSWIIDKYPNIASLNDIPFQKLEHEIDSFCDEHSYTEVVKLKTHVNNVFKGQIDDDLLSKLKRWFAKTKQENPFNRYRDVNFHGIFLFPYFKHKEHEDFINETWYDLNSFTGNWIDIYYSSEDLEKKTDLMY
jgi:hypothetical protein